MSLDIKLRKKRATGAMAMVNVLTHTKAHPWMSADPISEIPDYFRALCSTGGEHNEAIPPFLSKGGRRARELSALDNKKKQQQQHRHGMEKGNHI